MNDFIVNIQQLNPLDWVFSAEFRGHCDAVAARFLTGLTPKQAGWNGKRQSMPIGMEIRLDTPGLPRSMT
ncbi:MAG: hypothetical protein Q8K28_20795 [Hoeflea sp.]|uniref:hypothetical protein n=1 Tax=Hoeflea sp. TaxID=1940281 RepID=UPI00272FFFC2|nr:hypothetical protein [Hoeflea sp.]MDP2122345.1 hypothetical protein [Hoeflea sp.]